MLYRRFGSSEIEVSTLGFGAGQIGIDSLDEDDCGRLLNEALNAGITLFDTARGYGQSEERIGRHLSWRRKDIVISTKVGYGIPGHPDWSYGGIVEGVNEALRRMRTDYLDIVHLHSCPLETLERGEVTGALEDCKTWGKTRLIGYSGDNEALRYAIQTGRFDAVESSVSICDQRIVEDMLPEAAKRGIGVITKRSIANAPWRFSERPVGDYCEEYWNRLATMNFPDFGIPMDELALRFAAFTGGVSSSIVGTTKLDKVQKNIAAVEKGPLPDEIYRSIRERFRANDSNWTGQI